MFLVPILLVAGISISHVVSWYDMANPINWAIYLSIAIEVGAMTSVIAVTKKIKGGVWFMFGIVTFIQIIGNIFYSYVHIDENSTLFKDWIELTAPLFEMMGTDAVNIIPHKRWLAILEGGLLPLISLTALHFYIKYDDSGDGPSSLGPTGPSEVEDGLPMDDLIGDEQPIEPITEIPDGIGPNSEYNKIMAEQWEKKHHKENTDRELGKYDKKFGPEYTKMMDEIHEDSILQEVDEPPKEEKVVDTVSPEIRDIIEEVSPELIKTVETKVEEVKTEPKQEIQPFSQPFSDDIIKKTQEKFYPNTIEEDENRRRILKEDDGHKTLVYRKRR